LFPDARKRAKTVGYIACVAEAAGFAAADAVTNPVARQGSQPDSLVDCQVEAGRPYLDRAVSKRSYPRSGGKARATVSVIIDILSVWRRAQTDGTAWL
jgi:hypothetical protein